MRNAATQLASMLCAAHGRLQPQPTAGAPQLSATQSPVLSQVTLDQQPHHAAPGRPPTCQHVARRVHSRLQPRVHPAAGHHWRAQVWEACGEGLRAHLRRGGGSECSATGNGSPKGKKPTALVSIVVPRVVIAGVCLQAGAGGGWWCSCQGDLQGKRTSSLGRTHHASQLATIRLVGIAGVEFLGWCAGV